MEDFEERQSNLITHKKKAIRYEEIRLQEETEQLEQEKKALDDEQADIDGQVMEDCQEEHAAKHKLLAEIGALQEEMAELQKKMDLLGQQKSSLELECSVHQKAIDQVKISKFKDRIEKGQKLRVKLDVKVRENVTDQEKLSADNEQLRGM